MIGRTLGPIRIVSRLGAGGMGTVYLGKDGSRHVAVKVLHSHLLEQEGAFKRFQREARVGLRIDHPRVVRTYDCDLAVIDGEPRCFLITEYVEGRTLARLLEDLGQVPESLLREIAVQIADGLDAIHGAGAVHRDLKPQNVLITSDDEVKIMDLGLASLPEAQRLSVTGQFLGTLMYAAPEQFRSEGQALDGRADLYSLGLVLHELASGTHPFEGGLSYEVLERSLREPATPLGEVTEGISPFFEAVVARLLAKRPEERFPTAAEFREIVRDGERSAWWRGRSETPGVHVYRRLRLRRETDLLGRDVEMARLRERYAEVRRGRGAVVLVEGEAGVGKTRLVDEFVTGLIEEGHDPVFLAGAFPPGGAATGVGAYVDALRDHLGVDGLEAGVARLLDSTPLLVPGFTALLRGEPPPTGAEPLSRDALLGALARAVATLATDRTVIWLVGDVQFAPEEGLAVLAALMPVVRNRSVLILATTHPRLPDAWLGEVLRLDHIERLRLDRLSPDVVEEILREALGPDALGAGLGNLVAVESDGNPYFVFEILRGLRENGTLVRTADGSWRTSGRIDRIELPDSLRGLVEARLKDLDPDDRHALEIAACCGFEFDPVLVADALGQGRIPTLRRFASLERSGRIINAVGRLFAFDHHLVQDELYDRMPPALREAVHAALVDTLESGIKETVTGATAAAIFRHGLLGGRPEVARRHLRTALEHLDRSHEVRRAAELSGRALAQEGLVSGKDRVDLLLRRAAYLFQLGRLEEEEALLDEAWRAVDGLEDPGLLAGVHVSAATLAANRGRYADALEGYAAAARLAREAGLVPVEVTALMGGAGCHADQGEFVEARGQYDRALTLAREAGFEKGEAGATGNLGFLALEQGRIEEARPLFERTIEIFARIGDRPGQARARGALGLVLGDLGRYEEALEHHEAHRRVAREFGDRRGESAATGNVGVCLLNLGRIEEAVGHLRRDRAMARELDNARAEATSTANLALAYYECGDLVDAREMAEPAAEMARRIDLTSVESEALRILGRIAEERDRTEQAREYFARSTRCAEASGIDATRAEALLAKGRLELGFAPEAARATLALGLERAEESGSDGVTLVASAHLARLDETTRGAAEATFEDLASRVRVQDRIEAADALWRATGEVRYRDLARAGRDEILAALSAEHRVTAARLAIFRGLAADGGGNSQDGTNERGVS